MHLLATILAKALSKVPAIHVDRFTEQRQPIPSGLNFNERSVTIHIAYCTAI